MSYWIWSPHVRRGARNSVQFILSPSDDAGPPSRGKRFAKELLSDLGVDARILSVGMEAFRAVYYSDYPDAKDWRDVWPVVWRYRIETDRERIRLPVGKRELETEAFSGKAMEDPDGPARAGCLVVADFGTETAAHAARDAVTESRELDSLRRKYRAHPIQVCELTIKGRRRQLQFDLGKFPTRFFAAGADYAVALEAICLRKRATLRFEDLRE